MPSPLPKTGRESETRGDGETGRPFTPSQPFGLLQLRHLSLRPPPAPPPTPPRPRWQPPLRRLPARHRPPPPGPPHPPSRGQPPHVLPHVKLRNSPPSKPTSSSLFPKCSSPNPSLHPPCRNHASLHHGFLPPQSPARSTRLPARRSCSPEGSGDDRRGRHHGNAGPGQGPRGDWALGWTGSTYPCNWTGVTCADGRVTAIQVGNWSLAGTLPPQVRKLTAFLRLEVHDNRLSGPRPSLAGLSSLQALLLHGNLFSGSPPPDFFSGLSSLQSIYLDDDPFDPWPIPANLKDAAALVNFSANSANVSS